MVPHHLLQLELLRLIGWMIHNFRAIKILFSLRRARSSW